MNAFFKALNIVLLALAVVTLGIGLESGRVLNTLLALSGATFLTGTLAAFGTPGVRKVLRFALVTASILLAWSLVTIAVIIGDWLWAAAALGMVAAGVIRLCREVRDRIARGIELQDPFLALAGRGVSP